MKRKLPLTTASVLAGLALAAGSASAATIASWDTWGGLDANFTATGVTANITSGGAVRDTDTSAGSDDGTFGSTLTGADTGTGRMRFGKGAGNSSPADFFINITNGTGASFTLDELLFDFGVFNISSLSTANAYSIVFNNITQGSTTGVLASATGLATSNSPYTDYHDVDVDASSITLAAGDVGRFVVSISGGSNITGSGALDNVAITIVPEPSSLALLGLSGLMLLARRRRS